MAGEKGIRVIAKRASLLAKAESALRRKGSRRRRHDATQRANSRLLSTEKQNGQAKMLVRFVGGELSPLYEL